MAAPSSAAKTPQQIVGEFWDRFITKNPSKVTSIFPRNLYATLLPRQPPHHDIAVAGEAKQGQLPPPTAADSYEAAVADCRARVARIARDCRRANEKFTDPDFDVKGSPNDCLVSLNWSPPRATGDAGAVASALAALQANRVMHPEDSLSLRIRSFREILSGQPLTGGDDDSAAGDGGDEGSDFDPDPGSTHRVGWIFEKPRFIIDGFSSSDIMQGGASEDCWWLSAVATICHRRELMDDICVARDEACGVYGFVFHRDGEWVPVMVDDYLFLRNGDFDSSYDPTHKDGRAYRKANQTGSEALYFASCADPNETWLPLMEKAYAKLHGDYNAIWGGYIGEAVEDLTGGVATEIAMEDVLDQDRLWKELLNANKEFVFGADILASDPGTVRNGLATSHAYSVLQAVEAAGEDGTKVQLVKIRNPWGSRAGAGVGEWTGPWSDGSKEWTPYWLTKLDYKFGDDGVFWMTFQDMLDTFTNLYRTRLFDRSWTVVQEWTSAHVAWLSGYLQHKFVVEVKKPGVVVIVLSQLDTRYFRGLEGQYSFLLHFILQKEGSAPGDYICRARPRSENFFRANRSVSCEVELEAGTYEVLPKLTATRDVSHATVEDVVKQYAELRPQKLRQIGLSFDLAHARAGVGGGEDAAPAEKESSDSVVPSAAVGAGEESAGPAGEDSSSEADETAKAELPMSVTGMIAGSGPGDGKKEEDQQNEGGATAGGGDPETETEAGAGDDDKSPPPWNAVCVMGLRLYAKDNDVSITLAEPKNAQEAASLAVDEKTPAGATM